jgi:heparanase 1
MVYFRAKIIFGLNALIGRSIKSDGSAIGAWNSTNAESLIHYTVKNNHTIHGWELGKNNISHQSQVMYLVD